MRPSLEISRKIYAFWCRYPSYRNFGDALTPWLIKKITDQYPHFLWPNHPIEKYLVVGSIMSYATAYCTVWGAGIIQRDEAISPKARLLAVRGPLTRERAEECNVDCPEIYGDPALLLPRFYQPLPTTRAGIGIIPHYLDKAKVMVHWRHLPELRFIDIQQPVESVINKIISCQFVASSTLHGIIAANAYGIPGLWVEFSKLPHGDGSKFWDYFLSIGQEPYEALPLEAGNIDPDLLIKHVPPVTMKIDLDRLWHACPFRSNL